MAYVDPMGGILAGSSVLYETWAELPDRARDYLEEVSKRLMSEGLEVETRVLDGDPAMSITEHAREEANVGMIVMATHGAGGLGRWLFGSVAEKVLHTARVPLLIVRPKGEAPTGPDPGGHGNRYKTILVTLDSSTLAEEALAEEALEPAADLGRAMGADLKLVLVATTPFDLVLIREETHSGWSATPADAATERLTRYLDGVTERLSSEGLNVQAKLTYGDPCDEIVKYSA